MFWRIPTNTFLDLIFYLWDLGSNVLENPDDYFSRLDLLSLGPRLSCSGEVIFNLSSIRSADVHGQPYQKQVQTFAHSSQRTWDA